MEKSVANCTEPKLADPFKSCSIDEIRVLMMDLECSGIVEVANPSFMQVPELSHKEKVVETTYMSPQVYIKPIQMSPEILRASEPQMMIKMCHLIHNHITFKGTMTPGPRAVSEMGLESSNGQSQPLTKDLSFESSK